MNIAQKWDDDWHPCIAGISSRPSHVDVNIQIQWDMSIDKKD